MIGGDEGIGKAEHDQPAMLRAVLQLAGGFEDGDAGAFCADQRACHVEAVLRQQLVEVVAGDAARNVGKTLPDQIGVGIADAAQAGINLALASAAAMMAASSCSLVRPTVMRVPS